MYIFGKIFWEKDIINVLIEIYSYVYCSLTTPLHIILYLIHSAGLVFKIGSFSLGEFCTFLLGSWHKSCLLVIKHRPEVVKCWYQPSKSEMEVQRFWYCVHVQYPTIIYMKRFRLTPRGNNRTRQNCWFQGCQLMVLRRTTSDNTDEQTPVAQDCKIWMDDLFILFSYVYIDDIILVSTVYIVCIF